MDAPAATSRWGGLSVLVVDDQATMARLLEGLFEAIGFGEVVTARDGPTALALAADRVFDLVVADLRMEPMSGLQLTKLLRGDARHAQVRVLMTTASRATEHVLAAKRVGVDDYLVKPFAPATLRARLERLFPRVSPG